MKTPAIATSLSFAAVACAAGVCFLINNPRARAAEQELAAFKAHVIEQTQKSRLIPVLPEGHYVVAMDTPGISPADRAQINTLKLRSQSLIYGRDLAAWFFTRCTFFSLVIAGFCWFFGKQKPTQPPEPAPAGVAHR